jgi:hypothetical protein
MGRNAHSGLAMAKRRILKSPTKAYCEWAAQMHDDKKLIFHIDAYSPETIPMAKLAEYMADFASLLGRDHAVHFAGLANGSTMIQARVEFEDVPKVTGRLDDIRRGSAPKDVIKTFEQIDNRLANDNAVGWIFEDGGDSGTTELLAFPGRTRPKQQSYGPFTQDGHLDGLLISVGGKDETISLRLQNGEVVYSNCETSRTIARDLCRHLFEPVRIYGNGRWKREENGQWTLLRFRVSRFDVLENVNLRDAVTALRKIGGSGWADVVDPLAELAAIRQDEDELH